MIYTGLYPTFSKDCLFEPAKSRLNRLSGGTTYRYSDDARRFSLMRRCTNCSGWESGSRYLQSTKLASRLPEKPRISCGLRALREQNTRTIFLHRIRAQSPLKCSSKRSNLEMRSPSSLDRRCRLVISLSMHVYQPQTSCPHAKELAPEGHGETN
jgi:hypothetical protein